MVPPSRCSSNGRFSAANGYRAFSASSRPKKKPVPPNRFGAGSGRHCHDGVQGMSVLGVELVPEHLELLHRVFADVDRRAAPDRVVDAPPSTRVV